MAAPTDGSQADFSGKIAAITCLGQDRIGEEIVAQLLLRNIAKVYVLTQTGDDFAAVVEELSLRQGLAEDVTSSSLEFVQCDLGSVAATAGAAQALLGKLQTPQRLDLLFCNASSPASAPSGEQGQRLSTDGVPSALATDYLGHYVLVNLLLPLLEQTASNYQQARIVVSTSFLYDVFHATSLDSITANDSLTAQDTLLNYSRSQLAKILLTRYIAKLEHSSKGLPIYANCFDATDIRPDLLGEAAASLPPAIFRANLLYNGQSPEDSASTAVFLAGDDSVSEQNVGGVYFGSPAAQAQLSGAAEDDDLMNNMWYWAGHKANEVLGKGWEDAAAQTQTQQSSS